MKLPDWVAEKRELGQWADVRYIDGSQLEDWLDQHPAVAARYARYELGLHPQIGARSVDEYWEEYSSRFKPPLSEDVLLCERDRQAQELLRKFDGGPGDLVIAADSPEEVTAFAVAAIRKAQPEIRLFLEARTLVVDNEEAARLLAGRSGLIFLLRGEARNVAGLLAQYGPTLVGSGRDQPNHQYEVLQRPSSFALGKAIGTMGFKDDEANNLARVCGRSITVLARRIPSGTAPLPPWLSGGQALIPALLAGAWDTSAAPDKEILTHLAGGRAYTEVERDLRPLLRLQDQPIDREQTVWKMRAPVDAFIHLGHLIGPDDLDRLRGAATAVFSQIEEPPDPNEPFRFDRYAPNRHSSWLRDGLATTLLLIVALHDQAELGVPGQTGQQYVDDIVRSLPGLFNDHRIIASLRNELPLLAEAAPDPLLSALERLLEGDGTAIRPIFTETDDILAPSSAHTGLLWALEMLAWDPAFFSRASSILARLAQIDPGGKLSNRPINSLREIFLSWSPNTNTPLQQRLAALDGIARRTPEVAWQLLVQLLPQGYGTSLPTVRPRFRESGASERETLTYGLVWESQREIVTRALASAGDDAERWVVVIKALANFDPNLRIRALELIDAFLTRAPDAPGQRVWEALRAEASRNRAFSDAKWALSQDELLRFDEVVRKHQSDDPNDRFAWLFNDWHPHIPGNTKHEQAPIDKARAEVLRDVLAQQGPAGVIALGPKVAKVEISAK